MFRSSIIGRSSVLVQLHRDPTEEYQIEGSYSQRCCKIYNSPSDHSARQCVAEIKRKVDPATNVMLGKDVFWLSLQPGFDGAFAMGLILILDQMFGDDYDDDLGLTPSDSSS
ncbi:protein LURP-one-related 5-like [Senna tora]|uniref:Protein LURP-one-related 5-like n=1 Tax=Senna tora TaxID=362788 RepID=A0A834W223_9FABA|nr:protein LURP-one-related 5-like [Senna tora]